MWEERIWQQIQSSVVGQTKVVAICWISLAQFPWSIRDNTRYSPNTNGFLLWGRLEAGSTVNICHLHPKLSSYPGGAPEKPGGGGGNPGGKPAGGLKPGGGPGIPGGANGIGGRARGIWPTISIEKIVIESAV